MFLSTYYFFINFYILRHYYFLKKRLLNISINNIDYMDLS